jgi:predicted DNA-binding protein (MmcQ/YjbR family)
MPDSPDIPADILDRLRTICLTLPEAHEQQAWVGRRWRIRTKTFAHVLGITDDYPPLHSREAPLVGDATVLTFRAAGEELHALANSGLPFYKPRWHPQVVGMIIEDTADWGEIKELLTESYCLLAPRKLVTQVGRPAPATDEQD